MASAVQWVYQEIRALIANGTLLAGQQLRQNELAERFGVSRTPLREAIARLEVEGLVVSEPNRGAVVFRPSTSEVAEIYDILLLLEPHAAELATLKLTGHELDDLEEATRRMEEAEDWEFPALNAEFHLMLYRGSRSQQLVHLVQTLRLKATPYVSMLIGSGGRDHAQEDHRRMIELIREGASEQMAALTRSHLQRTRDVAMPIVARRHGDPWPPEDGNHETADDSVGAVD